MELEVKKLNVKKTTSHKNKPPKVLKISGMVTVETLQVFN